MYIYTHIVNKINKETNEKQQTQTTNIIPVCMYTYVYVVSVIVCHILVYNIIVYTMLYNGCRGGLRAGLAGAVAFTKPT